MMSILGNPMDYLLIFGGTSVEDLTGDDTFAGIFKIKQTLNDFWVFNIRNKLWQPLYPNSLINPPPTESAVMIPFIGDRLAIMFGGQYGETLRNDIWSYNINTNLWSKANILDKSHQKPEFFYNCGQCEYCSKCEIEQDIPD